MQGKPAPTPAPSLAQVDTVYTADSIEFCPVKGYESYFTCGTYQLLDPETGELLPPPDSAAVGRGGKPRSSAPAPRVGRLLLYSLDGTTPVEADRVETAAILDAKWAASPSGPRITVADAKGALTTYALSEGKLQQSQRLQVADTDRLVLSLDHRPGGNAGDGSGALAATLSTGEIVLVDPERASDEGQGEGVVGRWNAHDSEPWVCAWEEKNILWSGGDDLALKRWDMRMPGIATREKTRGFNGGVTTIAPSPHEEHLLAVGSYDAHLRFFDTRSMARPLLELEMPGGIWRTRWNPYMRTEILNACTHGGFAVARVGPSVGFGQIMRTFPGTLGYGADWCRLPATDDGSIVATCSFYDHVMNVWRA